MRIIFFGTPEFAVPSLEILVKQDYEIAAVITSPDKQAGRGLQIKQSAIKKFADQSGIKTLQPVKLSDPVFISELKSLGAELFIVVAFRMLPESIWNMPPKGTFNLHSSLLPQYRGAAPINRAIMNGETETGVTTFFLKHEIDTGNILFREKTAIGVDETAGELHDRLKIMGAELVLKTVEAIKSGTINEIPQENEINKETPLKIAPKIFPADCRIDWNQSAAAVHNHIRGLSPFPGAYTFIEDPSGNRIHLKIYKSLKTEMPSIGVAGKLNFTGNRFFVQCNDFPVEILELQQEGKKRMTTSDFLKGFRIEKGWKINLNN